MRRTKAAEFYCKTGNLRAVQLLLGHTKVDSAVQYLGVEIEEALSIAESIDISMLQRLLAPSINRPLHFQTVPRRLGVEYRGYFVKR